MSPARPLVSLLLGLSVCRPVAILSLVAFLPGLDEDAGIGAGVLTDDDLSSLGFLTGDSRSSGLDSGAVPGLMVPMIRLYLAILGYTCR